MTMAGASGRPTEPEVLAVRPGDGAVELDLSLPSDLLYFDGHFPAFAILPGVVQLHWAIKLARVHLPIGPAVPAELQVKFRRPIRPAAQLILGLSLKETGGHRQVIFDYGSDGVACSSGRITLCGP
jgi:3-hydroxymyristoyl/3-hydroxydecanoyl-(acyl carrier protein) dehydratase